MRAEIRIRSAWYAGPTGPGSDLARAVAALGLEAEADGVVFYADLGLDGTLRPVRGAASAVVAARLAGARAIVVARANAVEAATLEEGIGRWTSSGRVQVLTGQTLGEVAEHLRGGLPLREVHGTIEPVPAPTARPIPLGLQPLLEQVRGFSRVLLVGPPGSGKTMVARQLLDHLGAPDTEGARTLLRIQSAAGLLPDPCGGTIAVRRGFRVPHHTVSVAGLVGGGLQARPGEVTIAHLGVLFLDELPEFSRSAIEALAGALRDGEIRLVRSRAVEVRLLAAPSIVAAAANPCPCGWYGSTLRICTCSEVTRVSYRDRLERFRQLLGLTAIEVGA